MIGESDVELLGAIGESERTTSEVAREARMLWLLAKLRLSRLVRLGLVTREGDRYRLAAAGREALAAYGAGGGPGEAA